MHPKIASSMELSSLSPPPPLPSFIPVLLNVYFILVPFQVQEISRFLSGTGNPLGLQNLSRSWSSSAGQGGSVGGVGVAGASGTGGQWGQSALE